MLIRAAFLAVFLSFSTFAQAANTPPGFDAQKWKRFVDMVTFLGEQTEGSEGLHYRGFSRTEPEDKTAPHKTNIFSVVGGIDSFNNFGAAWISVVAEDWRKLPDGNWEIEQWLFKVSMDGELTNIDHGQLVETTTNTILEMKSLPVDAADSQESLATWGNKLEEFYKVHMPE